MKYIFSLLILFQVAFATPYNDLILSQISKMPKGGGYSTQKAAFNGISNSIYTASGQLSVIPKAAQPSFCSSATYLVFLKTLASLQKAGIIDLSKKELERLKYNEEDDGHGFWGRWNANGPGVAKLFRDLNIGENFEDYGKAQAGDFMKIFWNDSIGKNEHGHLVIYLGRRWKAGKEYIKFWSSNQPNGYGVKEVPRDTVSWAIFSRFANHKNVKKVSRMRGSDSFLIDMLSKDYTRDEVRKKCKISH